MALLLAAVAGVGILGAGAVGLGAAGVAGTVFYKKKKSEDDKLKHKALLSSLGEQWEKEKTNVIDPVLFPKSFSNWENSKINISQETVSFGMGWENEGGTTLSIDEVQIFCAAFNKKGKLIELITPHFPETNFGIKHTGLSNTPKLGRTYSGQADKQNIVINLAEVGELKSEVHYLVVGTIITASSPVLEGYLTLFNGTDVGSLLDESNDPALVRIHLQQSECGVGNGFIMGAIIKGDENLANWYYNPIRSPIISKSIRDIVPRMQQLLITPDQIPNSSIVNFNSEKTVESIWFGFDRFGYLRFCKEQQFPKEDISFENFNLTDGVTKIFLVTITNFNEGDSFQITTDDQTLSYPVIHSNIQVVCGFYMHEANTTIPFPVRMHEDSAYCIPYLAPINGDPSQSHILRELREKYIPFTANTVSITVLSGSDLTFPVVEGTPAKKTDTITPVVSVTLNKIKKKTTAKKNTTSPEWNETVLFTLEQDWIFKESVVTFVVKDKKSGKLLGETGYCLKSLRIPYIGSLQLEKGVGTIFVHIDLVEKAGKH